MSIPVPLGVRVYQTFLPIDANVTRFVNDLQYRMVIPGGFASATIQFHQPSAQYGSDELTGSGTASGNSGTPDYIVVPDAQAASINIGDRGWVYTDSTLSSIRFDGVRLRVIAKVSFAGFTNLEFDKSPGITNTGNVFRVTRPSKLLTSAPIFSQLAAMFNRVQIFDKRSMEICWEGRIEEPARQSSQPNAWILNCLGSKVSATDIERPVFYMDADPDNWHPDSSFSGDPDTYWNKEIRGTGYSVECKLQWNDGSAASEAPQQLVAASPNELFMWNLGRSMAQYVGRFHVRIKGWDDMNPTASAADADGQLQAGVEFRDAAGTISAITDLKFFNSTESEFNDILGSDLLINDVMEIFLCQRALTANRIVTTGGHNIGVRFRDIRVQAQRKDRFGVSLTTSTNYDHGNYVTVPMVVEDVVGRFLVKGWDLTFDNAPYPGSVRSSDAYIDGTSTKQIIHMVYKDGTTAAQILDDCMIHQPEAYWAIWESKFGAEAYIDSMGNAYDFTQFRFEWATWPESWGYFISEYDEFNEQPSGEQLYNFVFLNYSRIVATENGVSDRIGDLLHISWGEGVESPDLLRGGFTRSKTLRDDNIVTDADANTIADQYRLDYSKIKNAGTIKVSRPVYFFDSGADSFGGGARMIDPWNIRPGKLLRVGNFLNQIGSLDHAFGTQTPSRNLEGALWRGIATDYSTSDNSCTIELDTPQTWNLPGQVAR